MFYPPVLFILLYYGPIRIRKKSCKSNSYYLSTKDIFRIGEKINVKIEIINNNSISTKIPVAMLPNIYWLDFIIEDDNGKRIKYTGPLYKIRLYGEMNLLPGYFYGRNIDAHGAMNNC